MKWVHPRRVGKVGRLINGSLHLNVLIPILEPVTSALQSRSDVHEPKAVCCGWRGPSDSCNRDEEKEEKYTSSLEEESYGLDLKIENQGSDLSSQKEEETCVRSKDSPIPETGA